jgi:hypothetical protein
MRRAEGVRFGWAGDSEAVGEEGWRRGVGEIQRVGGGQRWSGGRRERAGGRAIRKLWVGGWHVNI